MEQTNIDKICAWARKHPEDEVYHNTEWGLPVHDDQVLFEFLILEGAQAGLSWITILRKRATYRKAFANFEVERVAAFSEKRKEELRQNPGIVRNRLKINSAVRNAKVFMEIQKEFGSFDHYLWDFVGGSPIVNQWKSQKDVPVSSKISDNLSKDLKKRGMNFVGSTIMYAYMQAVGMVNDHTIDCYRWKECQVKR
jgi:DNA-3-methyladenine glycosylase I